MYEKTSKHFHSVVFITHRNPSSWDLANNFLGNLELWDAVVQNRKRCLSGVSIATQRAGVFRLVLPLFWLVWFANFPCPILFDVNPNLWTVARTCLQYDNFRKTGHLQKSSPSFEIITVYVRWRDISNGKPFVHVYVPSGFAVTLYGFGKNVLPIIAWVVSIDCAARRCFDSGVKLSLKTWSLQEK